jgi:hypothetical protein
VDNGDEWFVGFGPSASTTYGMIRKSSKGNGLNIYTHSAGELGGTWYCKDSLINGSSRNIKHNIELLSNNYAILFDNLNPIRYKYNDGTSNRYHTGFIVDEVETAISKSGLTTQDFAAYCISDPETGDGGLRYEKFISLNTWQIQLLKPRMTAAEEKIAQLELEISSLKSELENLKKS